MCQPIQLRWLKINIQTHTTKQCTYFDRNFDRKNPWFWPNLPIVTEILTEFARSEKRWSKFFFDRSVKKFWPKIWPTDSRSKFKFDRNFDRLFGQKISLTDILTENVGQNCFLTVFFGQNTKFWPKVAILTELLTENHRSEKRWSKLFFDRSVTNFWPKFPVKIIFWPKFSVKIIFWPNFWPKFSVKIIFWPKFGHNIILTEIFGQNFIFRPKIRSKFGQNSAGQILKKNG